MRLVRIGAAALSVKVGDFAGNVKRLRAVITTAQDRGVHLLVTPELSISGYSLEDRLFWPDIARHSWAALAELASDAHGIAVVVGLPIRIHSLMYNAAALLHEGRVCGLVLKRHLPTYSVFYEMRNWTPWSGGTTEVDGVPAGDLVFRLPFGLVSAEICEDLWSANSPAYARVRAGAEIIANPSASPFTPRKNEERKRLIQASAANLKAVYAYANLLGSDNSRLVFDGGGIIATPEYIAAEGEILSKQGWTLADGVVNLDDISRLRSENTTWRADPAAEREAHGVRIVDASDGEYPSASLQDYAAQLPKSFYVPTAKVRRDEESEALDELFDALVLGLRDYYEKVGVFRKILVALSGGRDSALCLLMAVHAAKALRGGRHPERYAEHIETVYLPHAANSTSGSQQAAAALAKELGVPFRVVPIQEESQLALSTAEGLSGAERVTGLAKQNLQARVRGAIMLNWANSEHGLVLVTSNLSEAGVGYSTTGGDNEGGFSPIANVPKTLVTRLLEHLAKRDGITSLAKVLAIPPSAELAPGQEDERDLMPYAVLDDLLYLYAKRRHSLVECWQLLCCRHPHHDAEQLRAWTADFGKRFAANQWKRDQHPVSLKVMELDLDPKTGFRFPVTQSVDYELEELATTEPPARRKGRPL